MIGLGLSPNTTSWEDIGSNIMKTLGDYLGWDSTIDNSPQSPLASLVSRSTWHLNQTQKVGQRGSAIWYAPYLGDLKTVRLEFALGNVGGDLVEPFNRILSKIGESVSLDALGMTFKWYSSGATTQGDDKSTEFVVSGIRENLASLQAPVFK
jgi:hypothetical protein